MFLGTESIAALPATAGTPHWFQCVGSVTADPSPFTFELTAAPANHTGVVVDWGDGSAPEAIGNWNGTMRLCPTTYAPERLADLQRSTVTTNACPSGRSIRPVSSTSPKIPGAVLVYGDNNAGCAPFDAFPKVDINLAFSPTWSFQFGLGRRFCTRQLHHE